MTAPQLTTAIESSRVNAATNFALGDPLTRARTCSVRSQALTTWREVMGQMEREKAWQDRRPFTLGGLVDAVQAEQLDAKRRGLIDRLVTKDVLDSYQRWAEAQTAPMSNTSGLRPLVRDRVDPVKLEFEFGKQRRVLLFLPSQIFANVVRQALRIWANLHEHVRMGIQKALQDGNFSGQAEPRFFVHSKISNQIRNSVASRRVPQSSRAEGKG